jgi:hypothetical protein
MTRPGPGRPRLWAVLAVVWLVGGCSLTGRGGGPGPPVAHDATTLPRASVAFTAKARQLGALGEDDELLLLGQSFCGLAEKGPIDDYVATYFRGLREEDRRQASYVFTAAATDLCPDQATALTRAASQVLDLG